MTRRGTYSSSAQQRDQPSEALLQTRKAAQDAAPQAVEALVESLDSEDPRIALRAAEAILELAFGRPGQMPACPTADSPRSMDDMSPAERAEILREALVEQERLAAVQAAASIEPDDGDTP